MKLKKVKKLIPGLLAASVALAGVCISNREIKAEDNQNANHSENEKYGNIDLESDITLGELRKQGIVAADGISSDYNSEYPSYYRNTNVTTIKNQSPYGTCWAFSTVALAELSILQNEKRTMDFSEMQVVYFTNSGVVDPLGGTAGDDNWRQDKSALLTGGGNIAYSTNALATYKGLVNEADVPYSLGNSVLSYGISNEYAYSRDIAHLRNAFYVYLTEPEDVKRMIMECGAVGTSYYDRNSAYNSVYNSYYNSSDTSTNHAIAIVGWDDNFPKENFNTVSEGDGAWLIRNSWGSNNDTHSGYFWISYYDTSLRNLCYAYECVSDQSEYFYDNSYQYDGSHSSVRYSFGSSIMAANVFTAQKNEELKAVMIYADADTDLEISVYTDLTNPKNPSSGKLVGTGNMATEYEGIYTIELDKSVILTKGTTFSVCCQYTGAGKSKLYIESDMSGWYNSSAYCEPDVSFYKSPTSTGWYAIDEFGAGNVRIKALTDTIATPEINSITVNKSNRIIVRWDKVESAKSYTIYRKTIGGSYKKLSVVDSSKLAFTDTTADPYTSYAYVIYASTDNGTIKGSACKYVNTTLVPNASSVSAVTPISGGGLRVDFSEANGATYYRIYRKEVGGSYKKVATVKAGTYYYDDIKADVKTNYYYKIVTVNEVGTKKGTAYLYRIPEITSIAVDKNNHLVIKWAQVTGAESYNIYRRTIGGHYNKLASVTSDSLKYTDKAADPYTSYEYIVYATTAKGTVKGLVYRYTNTSYYYKIVTVNGVGITKGTAKKYTAR